MRHITLSALAFATLVGCTGGDARLGERCTQHDDCQAAFQCLNKVCVDRCQRSPECGDGFACDEGGICRLAEGQAGDACRAETDCGPGLSCQINKDDPEEVDEEKRLRASCIAVGAGRPSGSSCFSDLDCRNGTCAMGHCIDLCRADRDCSLLSSCMVVPRVEAQGALFGGCLPTSGNIVWPMPVLSSTTAVLLPVPSGATHASIVFEVNDPTQTVGATDVLAPSGNKIYAECPAEGPCTAASKEAQYFANDIRHASDRAISVLAMPASPDVPLEIGVYRVSARTSRIGGQPGSIPKLTSVVRIGAGGSLDLHLHFLDLAEHPCQAAFNNQPLNAALAQTENFFEDGFLKKLRTILEPNFIKVGNVTYHDIVNRPDLDALDVAKAGSLLALGSHPKGVNIFFVRSLSPVGLQAFGPGPGPAGLASTRKSGIVIGIDTLCYRSWQQLARLTAHEIARYMGLHHNVEVGSQYRDPILDSDDHPSNLMYYSELGGGESLSNGQRDILLRSPILQ